ncbi:replication initiation protein (plasmid) [Burkholderia vietnamiensis]|nr:replication initiation protein [Burkholderia vietnamiensis]
MTAQTDLALSETPEAADLAEGSTSQVKTRRQRRKRAVVGRTESSRSKMVVVKDEEAETPVELRKAPETIIIRNMSSNGEITYLQRKAYNAMVHIAQKNRKGDEVTFEVSVAEFASLCGQNTPNSRDYLKQMAREVASIRAEFDFRGDSKSGRSGWGVANMIAEVYISDDGQSIKFSFPSELAKRVLDPEIYNRIDMRMQNVFTSHSALTLWEITTRYWGSPNRRTFREHWTTWSVILSGQKEPHAQFRDFNKMLVRALDQVNAHESRFKVIPHLSKQGRKMDELWFVLEDQEQPQLPLDSLPAMVSEELIKRLRAFGVLDEEVSSIALSYDEEYLLAQADYTDKRLKKKDDPVTSPKAFFMSAVEGNYAKSPRRTVSAAATATPALPRPLEKLPAKPDAKQALSTVKDAWKKAKLEEIRATFVVQTEEKKAEIVAGIEDDLRKIAIAWKQYSSKGITKLVETTVVDLIFKKNVPEPSAEELLQFALETGSFTAGAAIST